MRVKPWMKHCAAMSLLSAAVVAGGVGCGSKSEGVTMDPMSGELKDTHVETIPENQVPADVMRNFRGLAPHAQITRVERRQYLGGQPYYQFHYALEGARGAEQVIDINPTPSGG
jgi:hypothetical protein